MRVSVFWDARMQAENVTNPGAPTSVRRSALKSDDAMRGEKKIMLNPRGVTIVWRRARLRRARRYYSLITNDLKISVARLKLNFDTPKA